MFSRFATTAAASSCCSSSPVARCDSGTEPIAVKLAVAAAILPRSEGALYVDVSVPTRAVAGYATGNESQVSAGG